MNLTPGSAASRARLVTRTSSTWQVEPGRYDVLIPAQATANPSEFTLTVRPTAGWRVVGEGVAADGSWTDSFTLDEPRGLTFFFEPTT